MKESGAALCRKHKFDEKAHLAYINKIEKRFKNPHVHDECTRVGREPCRKLKEGDRLVGPIRMAQEFGLGHDALLMGVAAALLYDNMDDPQSRDLQERIQQQGIESVLEGLGFKRDGGEFKEILKSYSDLKKRFR